MTLWYRSFCLQSIQKEILYVISHTSSYPNHMTEQQCLLTGKVTGQSFVNIYHLVLIPRAYNYKLVQVNSSHGKFYSLELSFSRAYLRQRGLDSVT